MKSRKAETEVAEEKNKPTKVFLIGKNFKIIPIISEKSRELVNLQNTYVFKIFPPDLNRNEIKKLVEKFFNVKVKEVRTINYSKRIRGRSKILSVRPKFKKAYVKLEKGYSISIFE